MMQTLAFASPLIGLLALGFAFIKSNKVNAADAGNERMNRRTHPRWCYGFPAP